MQPAARSIPVPTGYEYRPTTPDEEARIAALRGVLTAGAIDWLRYQWWAHCPRCRREVPILNPQCPCSKETPRA